MINYINLVRNEVYKELSTTFTYKFQWVGELFAVFVYYFYLSYLPSSASFSLEGYAIWFYCIVLIGDLGGKIAHEMKLGTFELNYISVFSLKTLLFSKLIASFFRSMLILLFLIFLFMFSEFKFPSLILFPILIVILPSLLGFSFLLAGLTLLFKEINWFSNILNNSMLFLCGIFISTKLFPEVIQNISFFLPTKLAEQMLSARSLSSVFLSMLFFQCIAYPIVGLSVFFIFEKKARKSGAISKY